MLAVFLGRLIPFIKPDLVSYATGVTGIRWPPFLLAVTAGAVPSTLFYTVIGVTGWVIGAIVVSTALPILLLIGFRRRISQWLAGRQK